MKTTLLCAMAFLTVVSAYYSRAEETQMTGSKENVCSFTDQELKEKLTPEQFRVARQNGTETPFHNAYWDNHRPGIYVDVVSGEPLFSSTDKFDSGTGWPSFSAPISRDVIKEKVDRGHGMTRTEVRSGGADSHLGHLFNDGPGPSGLRYCINSAALRFIAVEDLEQQGYGEYLRLFKNDPVGGQKDRPAEQTQPREIAIFAAGCFWGVEESFRKIPGVLGTTVGYTGGHTANPTYKEVCGDKSGHAEAIRVEFDPARVTYDQLLNHFWQMHNPTTRNRQGPDFGSQYRSAIFFTNPGQERTAQESLRRLEQSGRFQRPVVTEITAAGEFYPAEEYHQRYLEKRGMAACGQ